MNFIRKDLVLDGSRLILVAGGDGTVPFTVTSPFFRMPLEEMKRPANSDDGLFLDALDPIFDEDFRSEDRPRCCLSAPRRDTSGDIGLCNGRTGVVGDRNGVPNDHLDDLVVEDGGIGASSAVQVATETVVVKGNSGVCKLRMHDDEFEVLLLLFLPFF